MEGVVEIRTYKLLRGTGDEFHRAVVDEVMPLLERWARSGPREAIVSRIEGSISVVVAAGELERTWRR